LQSIAITFNCPCGKILSAKDRDAGLKAVCPHCGRHLRVPASGPAEGEIPPTAKLASAAKRLDFWLQSHQRLIVVTVSIVGAVVLVGLLGFHALARKADRGAKVQVATVEPRILYETPLDEDAAPAQWQASFHSFAARAREAIAKEQDLSRVFEGKPVRWLVTLHYMQKDDLYFYEREPLLDDNFQVRVWATLLPNDAEKARRLRPGGLVAISGEIGSIEQGRSHDRQYVVVRPVQCEIESIVPPVPKRKRVQ